MGRRLFGEIARAGLRFAFHSWGTALEVIAAAHLGICWPETVVEWLEYPCYSAPRDARACTRSRWPPKILTEPLEIDHGDLIVPREPGLGVTVDESVIERYPWIPGPWSYFRIDSPRRNSAGHFRSLREMGAGLRRMSGDRFRYYDLLVHVFVVVLLISNLVGQKITAVGPFRVSGAQLLFPITYIFGDVFTEVYGYGASRRAIWIGFFASALLAVMGLVAVWLPPAPGWDNQAAFATVFNFVPRLIAASLIAFWCGEFANSFVMAKMKLLTKGRYLWTRTVGSTVVGQAVDTSVVMVLAFGGSLTSGLIANLIVSGYLGKVLYEVAATPLTYWIVNFLKRREGVDTFDANTDFNPFHGER